MGIDKVNRAEAEAEPHKTRRERLRDDHFYHHNWHTVAGTIIPPKNRTHLLEQIEIIEEEVPDLIEASAKAKKAADKANQALRDAQEAQRRASDNLAIYKLALADEMQIPV